MALPSRRSRWDRKSPWDTIKTSILFSPVCFGKSRWCHLPPFSRALLKLCSSPLTSLDLAASARLSLKFCEETMSALHQTKVIKENSLPLPARYSNPSPASQDRIFDRSYTWRYPCSIQNCRVRFPILWVCSTDASSCHYQITAWIRLELFDVHDRKVSRGWARCL